MSSLDAMQGMVKQGDSIRKEMRPTNPACLIAHALCSVIESYELSVTSRDLACMMHLGSENPTTFHVLVLSQVKNNSVSDDEYIG